jgi:glycosyltransferase involved in cell wall biosynthesis
VAACDPLVKDADAITVSGEQLGRRYGGIVLGQPRDETLFDPARFDRRSVRDEFGYEEDDRVVLFLGSPRPHKGIRELADAIREIKDRRVKLCVIGSFNDAHLRAEVARLDRERIRLLDYRPFAEVPRLLMIGDLVCLPQDPSAEVVAYQTPMKLTEALAMGIPVLARETPSLAPYMRRGVIETIDGERLSQRIIEVLERSTSESDMARRGREYFLENMSYAAARRTIDRVIDRLPPKSTDIPPAWARVCELAASLHPRSTPAQPTRTIGGSS